MKTRHVKILALVILPTPKTRAFYRTAIMVQSGNTSLPTWEQAKRIFASESTEDWENRSYEDVRSARKSFGSLVRGLEENADLEPGELRIKIYPARQQVLTF
ncbi:hypothetical protein A3H16_04210 [Candidatus Kaiserbacteria bacterium RIFCSPLOWO2_12_FULL_53_8]|uniref:Uncharacterized protein n=2 Tax=Candidatus Kaiseribacteriota TaxID=1752734 RepID=A0A1F6CU39_9BACT|nr:MAG: hypothetical protein A2851_00290 [Candidatus Kaiserbacteria bacterium RIFCSPHIGHO2_01_FULL_53_29]OGG92163.1 MAG: hypothetical protein A3H16_04210 [Candidatus Kaiserbacteria bacterium RIFCSPLOWO2_12_FULL_53_8]